LGDVLVDFELWGKAMGGVAGIGHGGGSWLALTLLSVVATTATILICLNSFQLGTLTRLIDRPDLSRKLHARDTPIVGGLAMMIPALVLTLLEALIFHVEVFMLAATFAASVVLAIGVLDDRLDLSAAWRLVGLFFVVFVAFSVEPIFVVHSIGFSAFGAHLNVPFHSLAAPITLLMIVGFVNATNMADGMNGQFLGSVLIWTILLLRYVPSVDFAPLAGLLCCAAAALVFNLRGRVFSGSAGAYSGALFIALCTIAVYRQTRSNLAAQTVAIWFWLPVMDCLRLMTTRLLASKSPLSGDRQHLHHILLSMMRQRYALATYLVLLGLPALVTEFNAIAGLYCLLGCAFVYFALVASQREVAPKLGIGTAINAGE
jgi:UDP-GlcNAc:undecaprenyl-phosphate GlcNAc-1-phosphate transferase